MSRVIPLTMGFSTLVDDEDYDFLMQWNWNVLNPKNGRPYAHRSYKRNGKTVHVLMHRVICDTPEGMDTDHIDNNSLNNVRSNLRIVSRSQNMWNRKPNTIGTSKFKGVYWHKQHCKWCSSIQVDKKRKHLGLYDTQEEAAIAYEMAARNYFGEYMRIK